jgi:hypothetical protein
MNDQNKDIIRIITVVVYNRPQYFKRCLLSIIKNNLKGWKIFFNIAYLNILKGFIIKSGSAKSTPPSNMVSSSQQRL